MLQDFRLWSKGWIKGLGTWYRSVGADGCWWADAFWTYFVNGCWWADAF